VTKWARLTPTIGQTPTVEQQALAIFSQVSQTLKTDFSEILQSAAQLSDEEEETEEYDTVSTYLMKCLSFLEFVLKDSELANVILQLAPTDLDATVKVLLTELEKESVFEDDMVIKLVELKILVGLIARFKTLQTKVRVRARNFVLLY